MIEVWDTSALILASRDPSIAAALEVSLDRDEVAITEAVLLEYLNGARSVAEYDRFESALRATHILPTNETAWLRALAVHRLLAGSGDGHQRSVRIVDLLIAAVAEGRGHPVVHFDEDYDRIARLTGQVTRWVAARP